MKLKILFIEFPYNSQPCTELANDYDHLILIKDPYHIEFIEGSRNIKGPNQAAISYEEYCIQLRAIIKNTITSYGFEKPVSNITIEDCKEPPNFEALISMLAIANITATPTCNLVFKNCSFSGYLYIDSTIKLIESVKKRGQQIHFNIVIDEKAAKPQVSQHDACKLAMIDNVSFYPNPNLNAVIRRFTDDQSIGNKISKLNPPSFFFTSNAVCKNKARQILLNFFSQAHQQRNDYTCGPATIKMIVDYYVSLNRRLFCGQPLSNQCLTIKNKQGEWYTDTGWNILNACTELEIAERVCTTEEVGSDLINMRQGLLKLQLDVLDDSDGLRADEFNELRLTKHKEILWDKFDDVFNLGIPIILNLRDREDVGHYEVAIGIDDQNHIILAEPGSALTGTVEFETVSKNKFLERWKNTSGKNHARFLILAPNNATLQRLEDIFKDTKHYVNGESKAVYRLTCS